ncbi:MAG: hypothetical protein ACFE9L_09030 [Candidatus Hodarchaeota archaeon]
MSLKSSMELLLALLYANNSEEIIGATRLVKMMFLLIKEGGFEKFEEELEFEAWDFGPWSANITLDFPQTLEELEVLEISDIADYELDYDSLFFADFEELDNVKSYKLSEKGNKVGKVYFERLSEIERTEVERIKYIWNNKRLCELIDYVYLRYADYTKKSRIRTRVFTKLGISSRIASLIGIIPYTSLEEEKEVTRKIIYGSHRH